jgi:hypothetical protein
MGGGGRLPELACGPPMPGGRSSSDDARGGAGPPVGGGGREAVLASRARGPVGGGGSGEDACCSSARYGGPAAAGQGAGAGGTTPPHPLPVAPLFSSTAWGVPGCALISTAPPSIACTALMGEEALPGGGGSLRPGRAAWTKQSSGEGEGGPAVHMTRAFEP